MKRSAKISTVLLALILPLGAQEMASASLISQWASSATASSYYPHDENFTPAEMTGAPNAQGCDGPKVWAGFSFDTVETVQLNYAKAVVPRVIKVYQISVQDAISKIEVSANGSAWTQVYSADPSNASDVNCDAPNYAEVLTVNVSSQVTIPIKHIRMTVDQTARGYAEIDAVQLSGLQKSAQTIGSVATSVKVKGTLTLPAKTNKALSIAWTSSTKTICTISAGKVKGIKKGICRITGKNAGNANYLPVTVAKTITVK